MTDPNGSRAGEAKAGPRLVEECFLFEHAGKRLAYFPKHAQLLSVTGEAWRNLQRLNEGVDDSELTPSATAMLAKLDRLGLLSKDAAQPPAPAAFPTGWRSGPFLPNRAALLLTDRCNLECTYCYSKATTSAGTEMPLVAALAAVDLIVDNARQCGDELCLLQFHGGGEPTCAWKLLVTVVEYFEKRTREAKLKSYVSIMTNGVIPEARLGWIIDHVPDLCISLDGPHEVHDRQRPKMNGAGSYANVQRTLDYLDQHDQQYYTVGTVTGESVATLPELATHLAERPGCVTMFLEPVFGCGRFDAEHVTVPTAEAFVEGFRAATAAVDRRDLAVRYSGACTHLVTDRFCETPTPSFTVTPTGDVTSCYMVTDRAHPRADLFFFGAFERESGRFVFDDERIERLRSHHADNVPACQHCFCKYHCAGGCLHQTPALGEVNEYRCRVTHALTADQLVAALPQVDRK